MFLSIFYLYCYDFFLSPIHIMDFGIITGSFPAGGCVATWAFYLKSCTPKSERINSYPKPVPIANADFNKVEKGKKLFLPGFSAEKSVELLSTYRFNSIQRQIKQPLFAFIISNRYADRNFRLKFLPIGFQTFGF